MLISDIVRRNAQFFADDDAFVVPGERTTSWGEVEERTNRLARALLELGLEKGDRIAMFAPNCGEYVEFYFSCAKSGVIGAALNIRLAPHELVQYLRIVEPEAILVHSSLVASARAFVGEVGSIRHMIGFGAGHGLGLDLEELL